VGWTAGCRSPPSGALASITGGFPGWSRAFWGFCGEFPFRRGLDVKDLVVGTARNRTRRAGLTVEVFEVCCVRDC
jgi:hypothetical protein